MGRLWRCLAQGEYGWLQACPLFESDFLQVTRCGEPAGQVTVGIAASSPLLPLPDLMLLARPVLPHSEELQLFGLLPLACVRLSLRSRRRHQLRVRLATGRTFYLRLLAPPRRRHRLFARWIQLLFLLRQPSACPRDPRPLGDSLGRWGPPKTPVGTGPSYERWRLPPNKGGGRCQPPPHAVTSPTSTPGKDRWT